MPFALAAGLVGASDSLPRLRGAAPQASAGSWRVLVRALSAFAAPSICHVVSTDWFTFAAALLRLGKSGNRYISVLLPTLVFLIFMGSRRQLHLDQVKCA